jgi:hypothetical protein
MSNDSKEAAQMYAIKVKGGDWHLSPTQPAPYDMDSIEAIVDLAAQSRHEAEREALVRKCAEICEAHRENWDDAVAQILALLDSGSQG